MIIVIACILGILACCIPMFHVDTKPETIRTESAVLGSTIKRQGNG